MRTKERRKKGRKEKANQGGATLRLSFFPFFLLSLERAWLTPIPLKSY
jgi:hypothetical protein